MVRCGQHATLAVQLAASSAPLWGRKSTSAAAVPTIAEEEASCGAYSGAASSPPAAPQFTGGASTLSGPATTASSSIPKQGVHPASLPGQNGSLGAEDTAAHTRAGRIQQESSATNGNQGHAATSKEPPFGPSRTHEAAEGPAVPASEVFREHQPCRRPAMSLQGLAITPVESAAGGLHAGASVIGHEESSSYIEGRVGGSYVKLAQLHPPGSMAAQSQMLSDSAGRAFANTAACTAAVCCPNCACVQ